MIDLSIIPNWVHLLAIIISPVVAVLVSMYIQDKKEEKRAKRNILEIMISTRHNQVNEQTVRVMNMIDIIFADDKDVRRLWVEYFLMLNNEGLNNENGNKLRKDKNMELIHAMANAVGIGAKINLLDLSRIYCPQGLVNQNELAQSLAVELLRVLKSTKSLHVEAQQEIK